MTLALTPKPSPNADLREVEAGVAVGLVVVGQHVLRGRAADALGDRRLPRVRVRGRVRVRVRVGVRVRVRVRVRGVRVRVKG